jgi:hypothetical protein
MSSTVLNRVNDVEPSLVVFGRDPAGKPRASWFDAASIDFAMSAAELMQMKIVRVVTEQQRAIAKQLARGRIFSSGRAFAPFARAKVYEQLLELEREATDAPFANEAIGAAASTAPAANPKRIVREGEDFVLPDGTRVAADEKGGFRLPNGEYVAALADGLLLPNGRRCVPDDAEGFVCP